MSASTYKKSDYPVVLFDSQCLVCDGFVRFVIRRDKTRSLKFSGLQSTKAEHAIQSRKIPLPPQGSVILLLESGFLMESDAVLEILKRIDFPDFLIKICQVIPATWRNALYGIVARNRYRFYRKRMYCPLPDPQEASRFI